MPRIRGENILRDLTKTQTSMQGQGRAVAGESSGAGILAPLQGLPISPRFLIPSTMLGQASSSQTFERERRSDHTLANVPKRGNNCFESVRGRWGHLKPLKSLQPRKAIRNPDSLTHTSSLYQGGPRSRGPIPAQFHTARWTTPTERMPLVPSQPGQYSEHQNS